MLKGFYGRVARMLLPSVLSVGVSMQALQFSARGDFLAHTRSREEMRDQGLCALALQRHHGSVKWQRFQATRRRHILLADVYISLRIVCVIHCDSDLFINFLHPLQAYP